MRISWNMKWSFWYIRKWQMWWSGIWYMWKSEKSFIAYGVRRVFVIVSILWSGTSSQSGYSLKKGDAGVGGVVWIWKKRDVVVVCDIMVTNLQVHSGKANITWKPNRKEKIWIIPRLKLIDICVANWFSIRLLVIFWHFRANYTLRKFRSWSHKHAHVSTMFFRDTVSVTQVKKITQSILRARKAMRQIRRFA